MKRQLPGLAETVEESSPAVPDGIFLVRLDHARYRWHALKPSYLLSLSVVEPKHFVGRPIVSRLYCNSKAMWKLGWFLRDFLYDPESLTRSEIDERAMRGLVGIVKISHSVLNGVAQVNFDGFAPASQWEALSAGVGTPSGPKPCASDTTAGKKRVSR